VAGGYIYSLLNGHSTSIAKNRAGGKRRRARNLNTNLFLKEIKK
jgi:hypothetical protein